MPCRFGFRVLAAFSVLLLVYRQTGTGKQGRCLQRLTELNFKQAPGILEVKEMFEHPFTVYFMADSQIEPHFQAGSDFYVDSTTIAP